MKQVLTVRMNRKQKRKEWRSSRVSGWVPHEVLHLDARHFHEGDKVVLTVRKQLAQQGTKAE